MAGCCPFLFRVVHTCTYAYAEGGGQGQEIRNRHPGQDARRGVRRQRGGDDCRLVSERPTGFTPQSRRRRWDHVLFFLGCEPIATNPAGGLLSSIHNFSSKEHSFPWKRHHFSSIAGFHPETRSFVPLVVQRCTKQELHSPMCRARGFVRPHEYLARRSITIHLMRFNDLHRGPCCRTFGWSGG